MDISLVDRYRTLVGAYFGVREMDEYALKSYVLKDIEEYTNTFLNKNKIDFDPKKEKEDVLRHTPLKTKLQDAMLILNELNADKELLHMIKKRIRKIEQEKND